MTPAASTEEIRASYRELARRLHPDRLGDASEAERALAGRRMREVNESWSVLRDPASRRRYDDELVGAGAARRGRPPAPATATPAVREAAATDDDLVDVMPPMGAVAAGLFRHGPWLVLVVVLGLIVVVTAYAGSDGDDDGPARPAVEAGSCLDILSGPTTTVVPCDGPHDVRVVRRVGEATPCPADTERRRLGTDGLLDCVVTD